MDVYGTTGDDRLEGTAGADTMTGGLGDDVYLVNHQEDAVVENNGAGTDTVETTLALYILAANVENLEYWGPSEEDFRGVGNSLNNYLEGWDGDDRLDGREGADQLAGLGGNDTYVVDHAGDAVIENEGGGVDEVIALIAAYTLGQHVENLAYLGASGVNFRGIGNNLANQIWSGDGNDTLDGGGGADDLRGDFGNDTYWVDESTDLVTEYLGRGTDTVKSTAQYYALPGYVENLIYLGNSLLDFHGQGTFIDNYIEGWNGNDTLNGAGGADQLVGLGGNDLYYVDDVGDVVTETAAGGVDTVRTFLDTYVLGANVENLQHGMPWGDFTGTGNALDNNMTGWAGSDVLYGLAGNDILDGHEGNDNMYGGAGDDTYLLDRTGDRAAEDLDEGIDTVRSFVSHTLGANIERLTLLDTPAYGTVVNGSGNSLDNVIVGNFSGNKINGGSGADTMQGEGGNDTYYVDNVGDLVIEASATGGLSDKVISSVSFALGANVEHLTLFGTAANGTGNGLANTITGNEAANALNGGAGADVLRGMGGADTMAGGLDSDTYYVSAGDVVSEAAGGGTRDWVHSDVSYTLGAEVEYLNLLGVNSLNGTGNGLANRIVGNGGGNVLSGLDGNDTIFGGLGDDKIVGGAGKDELAGGAGLDRFYFDTALNASTNVDNIADFAAADDTIFLKRSVFTGIGAGTLSEAAFHNGTAAAEAADRIVYNQATGKIFYDSDGIGGAAAILFATVAAGTVLTHADFIGY